MRYIQGKRERVKDTSTRMTCVHISVAVAQSPFNSRQHKQGSISSSKLLYTASPKQKEEEKKKTRKEKYTTSFASNNFSFPTASNEFVKVA